MFFIPFGSKAPANQSHRAILFVGLKGLAAAAVLASFGLAHAEGARHGASDPTWVAECGTCHVPYPPALLGARSWASVMKGLDKHFGTDATLEPAQSQRIASFLQAHAAQRSGFDPQSLRLTDTEWFKRRHREVDAAVWKRASIKTASNCQACHAQAAQGDFDEDRVRIPR
jgi:cytochrome c553